MKLPPLGHRFVTLAPAITVFAATSAFAQTAAKRLDVELMVNRGEKSVETDADLIIETDYAIIKLGGHNHRQIVAELQTHGVQVSELKEEGKK